MKKYFKALERHLRKHWKKYLKVSLVAAGALLISPDFAWAAADIDSKAYPVYWKLVSIGKWIIIIKGAIETIQSVLNGDYQGAKKQFFSYIACFAIILVLPWGMDQVEGVFK